MNQELFGKIYLNILSTCNSKYSSTISVISLLSENLLQCQKFCPFLYVKSRNASLHTNVSWYLTLKTIHNTHNYLLSTGPNNSEYNFYSFFGINLKCKQCYEVIAPTICLFLPIANVTTSFI